MISTGSGGLIQSRKQIGDNAITANIGQPNVLKNVSHTFNTERLTTRGEAAIIDTCNQRRDAHRGEAGASKKCIVSDCNQRIRKAHRGKTAAPAECFTSDNRQRIRKVTFAT